MQVGDAFCFSTQTTKIMTKRFVGSFPDLAFEPYRAGHSLTRLDLTEFGLDVQNIFQRNLEASFDQQKRSCAHFCEDFWLQQRPKASLIMSFKWGLFLCIFSAFSIQLTENKCFFLNMGHSWPLFLYFRLFKTQLTVNKCSIYINKFLPMTGFELRTSGIGSNRFTN